MLARRSSPSSASSRAPSSRSCSRRSSPRTSRLRAPQPPAQAEATALDRARRDRGRVRAPRRRARRACAPRRRRCGLDRGRAARARSSAVDAESGEIVRRIPAGRTPSALAVGGGRPLARGRRRTHGASDRPVLAGRRDARDGRDADGHRVRRRLRLGRERPALEGHAVHRAGRHGGGAPRSDDAHGADRDPPSREWEARRRISSTTTSRCRPTRSGPSRRTSRSFEPTRRRVRSRRRSVTCRPRRSLAAQRGRLGARSRRFGRPAGRALGSGRPTSVHHSRFGRVDRRRQERSLGHDPCGRERCGASAQGAPRRSERPSSLPASTTSRSPRRESGSRIPSRERSRRSTRRRRRSSARSTSPASLARLRSTARPSGSTVIADPVAAVTSEVTGVATFAPNVCEPPLAGENGLADFLITSDLPLQGGARVSATQMAHAIEFVLRERRFRAGAYRVAYQSCDDSIASTGLYDEAKCASNARAYGENPDVLGVVGTFNSACAVFAIPELNRAPNGPLAMVSPFNDFVGLTRQGPGIDPSLPAALYPTGVRNFVRVFPTERPRGRGARPARARSRAIARLRARRRRSRLRSAPGHGVRDSGAACRARGRGADVLGSASGRVRGARASRRRIGSGRRLRGRPHRHECGRRRFAICVASFPTMSTCSAPAASRPLRS